MKTLVILIAIFISGCFIGQAFAQDAPKRTVAQVQMEYDAAMWRLTQATQEVNKALEAEQKKLMTAPGYVEKQKTARRLKKELDGLKGGSDGK
jgi:hypothetical protein